MQTTERYIGCKQRLRLAVNDKLGIELGFGFTPQLDVAEYTAKWVVELFLAKTLNLFRIM